MQRTIIEKIEPVAADVVSLALRGVDGPLAPWDPGAHVDVVLPNWLTRQYSLCGDPADRDIYRVAVRLDPLSRGGSEYIHLFLAEGKTLEISLPRNNFHMLPAPEYLFVAGGIGITPMVAMMASAVDQGASATLLYVGRSVATMPFVDELRSLHGDRVHIHTTEHDGRPDFADIASTLSSQTMVYCCGSASMLEAVESSFPAERLHVERFAPTVKTFAPNAQFEVHCMRSGQTVPVGVEESMLDALNYAGFHVPSGCREGVCGSCEVVVLDGQPEHRDDIGAAAGTMYTCVSRALSAGIAVDL